MVRLPWDQPIPFDLLRDVIAFNIDDKRDVTSFWRK
ncbi:iron chaperone [Corynebacterium diphtheriae]|nr:iron chaperone [Corynebacterium diphtheriae]